MQLVEQLHVKQTDALHHLVSRKRKLAELFAATACAGELPFPPTGQIYLQQLQVFQDANDLTKGLKFNESTLPPRPQIKHQPRNVPSRFANKETIKHLKDVVKPKSPPLSNENDVVGKNESSSPSPGTLSAASPVQQPPPLSNDSLVRSQKVSGDLEHRGTDPQAAPPQVNDQPPEDNIQSSIDLDNGQGTVIGAQQTASEHARSPSHDNSSRLAVETHSSPASTNAPPSSNTPVPTTGSPTTSLGGEDLSGSAILDAEKRNSPSDKHRPHTPETMVTSHVHKLSVSSLDVDNMDIDPVAAFDSPVQQTVPQITIQREASARPKPPIRVNTQHDLGSLFKPQPITSGAFVETPAPITGTDTPRQEIPATPLSTISSPRRATRISSGALQKKSVSEILGEVSKTASPMVDSPISAITRDAFTTATAQSRQADRERKERERSKLSTVVFAKPQRPVVDNDTIEVAGKRTSDHERTNSEDRDYLYTLFESKAYSSKSGNLSHLIQHAHKTITTADHLVDYEYQAQCRVLKRLYQLQNADHWALRQRKRADEPPRPTSHWDFLLDHMKWMRTDFREERKWKYAAAQSLAEACAEWVASTEDERRLLQVRVRQEKVHVAINQDVDVNMDENIVESHPTPDLLTSGEEEDSVADDIADPRDINLTNAPAAIFSLGAGEFNFITDKTPAFDKVINELPLYEPAKIEPDLAKSNLAERLDARWKTDIVHVSRFTTEKLRLKEAPPLFSKTRYDYDLEPPSAPTATPLPPREANVGLFMPENKHIRDRIHPGHSFRPPSEHPMPTQAFFETRASSQWTAAEDDELRRLVKDYSYNWSLISSCLSAKSLYTSSADRRTPWECFERWIGLEGMPADMAKTPYFRTYSGRIEAAGRHLQAQLEEAQRRAGPNATVSARKRTSQPVRVERKRAQRHLAMLDAMRKLAKKRETMQQKQKASAEMAAQRGKNEMNNQQRPPYKTPAEWSQLKHEREQKMAKQQELYRQQLIAHQRAATAQQHRGPNGVVNGVPNGMQAARGPNGVPVPMPNGHLAVPNGVPRPHPSMLGVPNGIPMAAAVAGQKAMQAQLQSNIRAGMNGSPQQQMRMQEQLMRQAQQNGNHSSPNAPHANMVNGHAQGFNGDMSGTNGQASPPNGGGTMNTSPRQAGVGQALSSGHVPVLTQIAASIKQRHPNYTDEEIQRAASQQLTIWQQQATAAAAGQTPRPRVNQAALNAALGAANAAAHAGNVAAASAAAANGVFPQGQNMMTAEQLAQYNQRLRMQQAQQHAVRGMQNHQMQQNMMSQMGNSPGMNAPRPVSQHANHQNMSRSATPRDQRTGSVSNINAAPSPTTNGGATTPANGVQQSKQGSPARPTSQQAMHT